jgi:hypothetical protein
VIGSKCWARPDPFSVRDRGLAPISPLVSGLAGEFATKFEARAPEFASLAGEFARKSPRPGCGLVRSSAQPPIWDTCPKSSVRRFWTRVHNPASSSSARRCASYRWSSAKVAEGQCPRRESQGDRSRSRRTSLRIASRPGASRQRPRGGGRRAARRQRRVWACRWDLPTCGDPPESFRGRGRPSLRAAGTTAAACAASSSRAVGESRRPTSQASRLRLPRPSTASPRDRRGARSRRSHAPASTR